MEISSEAGLTGISGYDFPMKNTLFLILLSLSFFASAQSEKQIQKNRQGLLNFMLENYNGLRDEHVQGFLTHCPQMQNTTGPNQAYCLSVYNNKKSLIDNLAERLGKVRNETISQEETLGVMSCLPVAPPAFNDLEAILRRLDGREQCSPMSAGDFKVSKFLLTRKPDSNYDAVVNVDFQQVNGNVSSADMLNKVNQCLVGFTPHLRSPSGETLNIRVMNPSQVNSTYPIGQRPPAIKVKIHQGLITNPDGSTSHFRADAENYPDNIPCTVILHETLHHLGLCDEYHETSTAILPSQPAGQSQTFTEAFSCRAVPARNTVMAQHAAAVAEVVPLKMQCKCKSAACRNTLQATDVASQAIQEMMTRHALIPGSVMRLCRDEYLNPNLHPFKEPEKSSVLISNTANSISFESRSVQPFPGASGSGPKLTVNRRLINCNCNGDAQCIADIEKAVEIVKNNPSATSCPNDTEAIPSPSMIAGPGESSGVQGDVLQIVTTPPSSHSLLSANHFNRILFRNCSTGPTANYNQCASFAYRGTADADCANKPAACSNDAFFLDGASQ